MLQLSAAAPLLKSGPLAGSLRVPSPMSTGLKTYRFAMGSPDDPCSATWRLWTQGDEAYLAARAMSSVAKMSLHSNGQWQFRVDKKVSNWRRPKPFRPGWIIGPIIVIPHNNLARRLPYVDPNPTEKIAWLEQPASGMVAEVKVLIAGPAATFGKWTPTDEPGCVSLATLAFRHSGQLRVVRQDRPLLPAESDQISIRRSILETKSVTTGTPYGISLFTVASHQFGGPLLFETQHQMIATNSGANL